jgi:hypothetical protein
MILFRYLMVIAGAAFALANLAVEEPKVRAAEPAIPVQTAKTKDITFDTIKFDIKKGQKFKRTMLTAEIESLKTQKIKLRGYMYPTFQQTGITQFVLVRDNMECCFGPGAMIYDCVMVEMAEGKTTDFSIRPIAVEGTFDIKPVDDGDGNLLVLYHIRGDGVK